jgi:predicted nucleotidyltransferase
MLKKDNRYKILEIFLDNPSSKEGFQLREISRKVKISPLSVKRYLEELSFGSNNVVIKSKDKHNYPIYWPNRDSGYFKLIKRLDLLKKINESGLLDFIFDECSPKVIILFGSGSLGEDILSSDIDLFVQSDSKKLDIKKYESLIKRKINILFEKNFNKLSLELRNNIINGIILKGYLKVF